MLTAKFDKSTNITLTGLTQWDYGQSLTIVSELEIPDGTEAQFYQGKQASVAYVTSCVVAIPDAMLQRADDVFAYVYVESEDAGETILTIRMPVSARPKPIDYILPGYTEYLRLVPSGGEEGQVLAKSSDADYDTYWSCIDDSMLVPMTDEEVDELFTESDGTDDAGDSGDAGNSDNTNDSSDNTSDSSDSTEYGDSAESSGSAGDSSDAGSEEG